MALYPVILCGGSGSRLWPVSREHYPKPLLRLINDRTLLQDTATRLDEIPDIGNAVYVCNEEHRFLVAEQVAQLGKSPTTIILEPEGKNTAPALTLATLYLVEQDPDAIVAVMPADHVITDPHKFLDAIKQGRPHAENHALVMLGVVPDRAETGYGYIQRTIGPNDASTVECFIEKPDLQSAEKYIRAGNYLWNSGIFLMRADQWLEEIGRFHQDILEACREAMAQGIQDADFFRVHAKTFIACPNDSIDYAVMEKNRQSRGRSDKQRMVRYRRLDQPVGCMPGRCARQRGPWRCDNRRHT